MECLGNWIVSPLGLCAGEPYRVCVCVCVCVSVCGCGCLWVWVCVECLGTGSSHLWFSVQVSPMAHTCVLCVCESEIVCVCVNLKSDQACGWQAGFERRAEGSY